jgi:alkylated DNA repair protein alkB family protein 6
MLFAIDCELQSHNLSFISSYQATRGSHSSQALKQTGRAPRSRPDPIASYHAHLLTKTGVDHAYIMSSAIDFNALLLEERKRARDQRRERKKGAASVSASAIAATTTTTTTTPTCTDGKSPANNWNSTIKPNAFIPSDAVVVSKIESVYYLPGWLGPEYGTELKTWLLSLPERMMSGGQDRGGSKCAYNGEENDDELAAASMPCWTTLRHARRRVALFDGRRRDKAAHATGALPTPLANIAMALVEAGIFPEDKPPNHVLVNDYRPSEGIMPHTDGPSYLDRTATISIGGSVILKFRRRLTTEEIGEGRLYPRLDLLLSGEGSLVVFTGDAYSRYLHSIGEGADTEVTTVDCANAEAGVVVKRSHRISLTFRHKY